MMRIFAYADPFKINENAELWSVVTRHPHFCASDTLVQGLEAEYGRLSFGHLRTIDALIEKVLGSFTNNPQNDIQLFLIVSSLIRELIDGNIKAAFRFNIADVVKSVRFLLVLGADINSFNKDELSEEQNILLEIYQKVTDSSVAQTFYDLNDMTKEDFIYAVRCTINDEIKYLCDRSEEYVKNLELTFPINTLKDGFECITKLIDYLESKVQTTPSFGDMAAATTKYSNDLAHAKYILSLITSEDDSIFDKIIIHGVHRITPERYFLFKLLEKIDIEVIFLINYANNLPNIYKTWREVYSWCDTKFEFSEDLNLASGSKLGQAIANVAEGKKLCIHPTEDIIVYSNLTSFTDREVKKTFKKAGSLSKMQTQYYAVRGESSNEILKIYFPEQFGQKPFLSYPIGQFILGLYQMWDFEANTLKINDTSLCECAVSRLYKNNPDINILEVLNKVKLYFSDVETIEDYYLRIEQLKTAIQIITRNNRFSPLKKISFFNVKISEIDELKSFLIFIEGIANKLFKNSENTVDFGKHFKTLMDIISIPGAIETALNKTELALIKEVTNRLSLCNEGDVTGNIEDVKEAITFYLAGSKKGDTSNWIVRDFDQIDGAVLLRKRTKAHYYHFALLSNSHMTKQPDDILPWPLTTDMFNGYRELESAVPVINKGLLEMRNFLKFSLFYGAFFTKCGVKLSFIEEENGEEQSPYYLLDVLGLEKKPFKEEETASFITGTTTSNSSGLFSTERLSSEKKEMFSICPYKFLQSEVFDAPIEYYSDYHIKYYVANFMYIFMKGTYNLADENIKNSLSAEFLNMQRIFPFWNKVILYDIEKNTLEQIMNHHPSNGFNDYEHEIRKENFLIAKWSDMKTGENYMNFNKEDLHSKITDYMNSSALYPHRSELPHRKICENCNFGEICLRNFYEAHSQVEGDE